MADTRVLQVLGDRFARSRAGRTGRGVRDFLIDYKELLTAAGCLTGDARILAEAALAQAEAAKVVVLQRHPRDREIVQQVRVPLGREAELFNLAGNAAPAEKRAQLAAGFHQAAITEVSEPWQPAWQAYCARLAAAALAGQSIAPFSLDDLPGNAELLSLAPRLLGWGGESLLRFVSCVLCRDSKRLGELRPKLRRILIDVSSGKIEDLPGIGILDHPRTVLIHGPLRLRLAGEWLDLGKLVGPMRLSALDLAAAEAVETAAPRCLSIENDTTFHELAKCRGGDLLLCTSYPGAATLRLLALLPPALETWHFGDSDPAGFDILRDLRERSARPFRSLHMRFRPAHDAPLLTSAEKRLTERLCNAAHLTAERSHLEQMLASGSKGNFEQESLGRPQLPMWPFYETAGESGSGKHFRGGISL